MIPLPIACPMSMLDLRPLFSIIAAIAGAVAFWAQRRATNDEPDPVQDLTERLRHPVRWSLTHPVQAIRRKIGR